MNKKALTQFIIVTMAVVILSLLYFFFPADSNIYPKCIFHSLTGLDCPGCGSQRAASALLHGKLPEALDYNLLFVLLMPFVVYSAFVFSWNVFNTKQIRQPLFYSRGLVKTILILILVFWIIRNIPVSPFNWLKA